EGNIIARVPHPEKFVGTNMRKSHESIMDSADAGWEEVAGVDGVTRIFGYVPSALSPKDFFLSVGEAKAEAFAAINSATWCDITLIFVGLLASIGIAWAGREFVDRPHQGPRWPIARLKDDRGGLRIDQETVASSSYGAEPSGGATAAWSAPAAKPPVPIKTTAVMPQALCLTCVPHCAGAP